MSEWFGLVDSLLFAFCSWPQVYMCLKNRSAKGIAWSFVILWWVGAFFSGVYAALTANYMLLPNYMIGGLALGFILLTFIGAIFSCIYIFQTDNLPLQANFGMTLITSAIMLKYKLFERK